MTPDDATTVLRLLTDRRQELVEQRIASVNRLHDVLLQLLPVAVLLRRRPSYVVGFGSSGFADGRGDPMCAEPHAVVTGPGATALTLIPPRPTSLDSALPR